jgi:uncharacterized membrane protein YagU involved in acid resistance
MAALAIFAAFLFLTVSSVVEIVLYFVSPTTLAGLAVFPFEPPRKTSLSPTALQRIARGPEYQGASAAFAPTEVQVPNSIVSALGLASKVDADTHIVYASTLNDQVVVRLAWSFMGGRSYAIVRLRLQIEQGELIIRSAFLPVPLLAYVVSLPVVALGAVVADPHYAALAFVLVIAALANSLFAWFRLKPLAQLVARSLESDALALQ